MSCFILAVVGISRLRGVIKGLQGSCSLDRRKVLMALEPASPQTKAQTDMATRSHVSMLQHRHLESRNDVQTALVEKVVGFGFRARHCQEGSICSRTHEKHVKQQQKQRQVQQQASLDLQNSYDNRLGTHPASRFQETPRLSARAGPCVRKVPGSIRKQHQKHKGSELEETKQCMRAN